MVAVGLVSESALAGSIMNVHFARLPKSPETFSSVRRRRNVLIAPLSPPVYQPWNRPAMRIFMPPVSTVMGGGGGGAATAGAAAADTAAAAGTAAFFFSSAC